MSTSCTLIYQILGVAKADSASTQIEVCEEIQEVLSHPGPVSARQIPNGIELSISVTDIEPFTREELEPYIYENVVWHAINACCDMEGDSFDFKLVSTNFK